MSHQRAGRKKDMAKHQTLKQHLAEWSDRNPARETVAATVMNLADSCAAIAEIIALGPLAGEFAPRG